LSSELIAAEDFKKMVYVLTQPTGMGLLRMTRPIEKVERNPLLQRLVMIFDIVNVLIFIACGIW
jgi:hypothetical protein